MDIQLPPQFKALGHYLKLATDFESRDPVISYWCQYHAVQTGLAIDKTSPEAKKVIIQLLTILEQKKKELHDNESITNDDVAAAYIENYILKLFSWADTQDRNSVFNKNVVKAFYNAGVMIDVLCNFNNGELSEDFEEKRKYAKWKAAYIHNCLKAGIQPKPGPMDSGEDGEETTINVPPPPENQHNPNANFSAPSGNYSAEQHQPSSPYGYGHPGAGAGGAGVPSVPQPQSQVPPANWSQYMEPEQPKLPQGGDGVTLGVEEITKAQKYCKWASSALTFDDVPAAITNLEKALHLLKTGKEA